MKKVSSDLDPQGVANLGWEKGLQTCVAVCQGESGNGDVIQERRISGLGRARWWA